MTFYNIIHKIEHSTILECFQDMPSFAIKILMWQPTGLSCMFSKGCYLRKMANFCLVNQTVGSAVMDNWVTQFIIIIWHLHRSLYFLNVLQPFFLDPSILPWEVNYFFNSLLTKEHREAKWDPASQMQS